jgi:PAS domain S-box-containing protein
MNEQAVTDERVRFEALREYDILDTLPEQCFDDLTLLAARICDVPIALIGFVKANRQWYKSQTGVDLGEIPRYVALCSRAVLKNELCVVPDALADEEYTTNPLVMGEPHIRFYAAVPLATPEGYAIGSLCVIDRVPRDLSDEQKEALLIIARQVMAQLELRKSEKRLRLNQSELERRVAERTVELSSINTLLKEEIVERKRAEDALRESNRQIVNIFESISDGFYALDSQWRYTYLNRQSERIVGRKREDLIGKNIWELFPEAIGTIMYEQYQRAFAEQKPVQFEIHYQQFNAWFDVRCYPSPDGLAIYYADITAHKRAKDALHESDKRFRAVFDFSAMPIALVDLEGRPIETNAALRDMLGYSDDELCGMVFKDFTHPNDAANDWNLFTELIEGKRNNYQIEKRYISKDNREMWGNLIVSMIQDGEGKPQFAIGMVQDITDRKRAENERLQLLNRFVNVQEEGRQRIARELHDQAGQYLAALMLGLKGLKDSSQLSSQNRDTILQLQGLTSRFAQELRRVSLELRPPALDDLGLHTTLSNYAEEWSQRYGVVVDFHSNGFVEQRLQPSVETTIYRIVQEALTNIIKHAQAKRVSILLEHRGNRAVTIVEDDGTGFDIEAAMNKPIAERTLGLLGMRERVELIGGTLDVESTPGAGTTIVVRIPTDSR